MEQSLLSRLSPELRNEIYLVIFQQCGSVTIVPRKFPRISSEGVHRGGVPGVLQCCKKMREETIQFFYATAVFHLECAGWDRWKGSSPCLSWIHLWLNDVGSQNYRHLRTVVIELGRRVECFTERDTLPLDQRKMIRHVRSLAPQIAGLAHLVPARALAITFGWTMKRKLSRVHQPLRQYWFRAKALRIFEQSSEAPRPYVSPEQHALSNSAIKDRYSACIVGSGRAILIPLVHEIWRHVICHTGSLATKGDLLRGMDSLQEAFAALDGDRARRALSFLPDDFRGYALSVSAYDAALANVHRFDEWVQGVEVSDQ